MCISLHVNERIFIQILTETWINIHIFYALVDCATVCVANILWQQVWYKDFWTKFYLFLVLLCLHQQLLMIIFEIHETRPHHLHNGSPSCVLVVNKLNWIHNWFLQILSMKNKENAFHSSLILMIKRVHHIDITKVLNYQREIYFIQLQKITQSPVERLSSGKYKH